MESIPAEPLPIGHNGDAGRDYLIDMIAELAVLARSWGEVEIAIHLEAILAADEARRRQG